MEQCCFIFPFIIEGAAKKVFQFIMPMEPIYNKNICFNEQKCILKYIFKIILLLFSKICSVYLFRAALSKLIFALHEGDLFICEKLKNSNLN